MSKVFRVNGTISEANSYNDITAPMLREIVESHDYRHEEELISRMLNKSVLDATDKKRHLSFLVGTVPEYDLDYVKQRLEDGKFHVLIDDKRNLVGSSYAEITIAW